MKRKKYKKTKKRSELKFPSLNPRYNNRIRQEYQDYDYVDQLSNEEKQFLEDFNKEYYQASVGKQKDEGINNRFTKGREAVKEAQDNNNHRNNDTYGIIRNKVSATKLLDYHGITNMVEEKYANEVDPENIENAIIDYMDSKKLD